MWVVSLNVARTLSEANARDDFRRALALAGGANMAGVVLWQEVDSAGHVNALKSAAGSRWAHAHLDTECPVSWRTDYWELVDAESHQISKGREHISPHRVVTITRLRYKPLGIVVVFVNTHFVSGAYSNPGQAGDDDNWRLDTWDDDETGLKKYVQPYIDKGFLVVGGGDYNRSGMPKFWPALEWVSATNGYDYLWIIHGENFGVDVVTKESVSGGWHTDHPARTARINFVMPDATPDPLEPIPVPDPIPVPEPEPIPEPEPVPVDLDSLSAALSAVETSLGVPDGSHMALVPRVKALTLH